VNITKERLLEIIKEEIIRHDKHHGELNEMLGGGNYPGARGPSTAHITVPEVENIAAAAGVQGLMYGHAVELMNALDRANIDRHGFEDMLRKLPHHTKTTGRPYSALSWIYDQIG